MKEQGTPDIGELFTRETVDCAEDSSASINYIYSDDDPKSGVPLIPSLIPVFDEIVAEIRKKSEGESTI